eukprot:149824-Chlamydomonas_euryale.AAC.3
MPKASMLVGIQPCGRREGGQRGGFTWRRAETCGRKERGGGGWGAAHMRWVWVGRSGGTKGQP